ncbi:hypothetical protein [Actinacidiphila acididurans]|uniref:Uncharacterized protein n=1 Tax=Actinacidiphila acididurans TaxID=2784346 RepID=A0ABS2TZX5_9ACTN|nr:hypothetical protein [Actinacidiphila acididurans]MBM9508046.1 hypothetical protein [Actinacidiphila acididurans]
MTLYDGVRPRRGSTEPGAFLLSYSLLGTAGVLEGQRRHASMAQDILEDVEEGDEDAVIGTIVHDL